MTRPLLVPLLIGCLAACAPDEDTTFGGGGTSGGDAGSSSGDDTGDASPDAPVITNLTAEFYDPPNIATVIEIYAYWEDAQGDVDGGEMYFSVEASSGLTLSEEVTIDGSFARLDDTIEGSPVTLWLSGEDGNPVDTSVTYDVTVKLRDVAGNQSAAATTSL